MLDLLKGEFIQRVYWDRLLQQIPCMQQALLIVLFRNLLFSGLFKFDTNNNLVGDLAEKWEVNERENIYTVALKKDLKWQTAKTSPQKMLNSLTK